MAFFERVIKFIVVWTLSVFFSILVGARLIFEYIIHCTSMPWKPKDRILMQPPVCFSDPQYGIHKFATVNVRPVRPVVFVTIFLFIFSNHNFCREFDYIMWNLVIKVNR